MNSFFKNAGALALVCLTGASLCVAQTNNPQRVRDLNSHSWWVYYGDHPVRNSKWGILTEMQIRRTDFASAWQQLLLRQGTTYRLSPRVQLGGGYGFIRTSRYGGFPVTRAFDEHRLFQQAILKHEAGRLELEHRYRVEQRWLEASTGNASSWRRQNRFRYQLRGSVPLSAVSANGQQWYLFAGDELFLHFGPNYGASLFDQNRAFAGIGYKLSRANRLEIGYLNQFLIQRGGSVEESNHTFRIQFTSAARLFGRR